MNSQRHKHIAIDIRCLGSSHFSGVHHYTYSLLEELGYIKNDNITYYLFFNGYKTKPRLPKNIISNPRFVHVYTHIPNKILNYSIACGIPLPLDTFIEKKHNITLDAFWFPNINFISVSKKCKKIITIHDVSHIINPSFFSLKRQAWHNATRFKQHIASAHHIIAVSKNTKQDILTVFNKDENSITVTPLAAPTKKKPSEKQKAYVKQKYNLPKSFIFFIGTLEPRKNISGIISGFNKSKTHMSLVIAGAKGWKYKRIFNTIQKSQKKDNIYIIDYIEENDKPALYDLADMFLFPSFYEGFGLPPLEAHMYEAQIISSVNHASGEFLPNKTLFVDPHNSSHIASAINQLSKTKEHTCQHAPSSHTWANTAQKTYDIFMSV